MENKTPAVTEHKDSIICPNCGTGLQYEAHKSEHHVRMLDLRNIMAILAAVFFGVSLLIDEKEFLIKAIAYGIGALAYLGELMAVTHVFKKRCNMRELLMPLLLGLMHIMLGLSYAIEHFHI